MTTQAESVRTNVRTFEEIRRVLEELKRIMADPEKRIATLEGP